MPRTIEEIRAVVQHMEHGKHGDGDMRAIGQVLHTVVDDAVQDYDPPEAQDLIRASVEEMKESLDHFLNFLDGHDGPLSRIGTP